MNGCKYCRVEFDGDIPDDRKSLQIKNFMSIMGNKIDLLAMITTGDTLAFDPTSKALNYFGETKYIKINYCPMCGRKLGGEEG